MSLRNTLPSLMTLKTNNCFLTSARWTGDVFYYETRKTMTTTKLMFDFPQLEL